MIYRTVTVTPIFTDNIIETTAEISGNIETEAEITTTVRTTNYDEYTGSLEWTPTSEAQTIPTDHLVVLDNITINPIPNNYGLITWDGAILTVS